jgi:hypothetical protein
MLPTAPDDGTVTGHLHLPRLGRGGIGPLDEDPRRACAVAHVDPGDDVGGPSEAAPTTVKGVPGGTVVPRGVPAPGHGALLRGRIHLQIGHPGTPGLVGDERAELAEGPRREPCSLVAGNRDPFADPLELFQGDTAPGALGDSDDRLGNLVVDMGGVPGLTASAS